MRFKELEGLRAWLAWAVVAVHLVQWSGLNAQYSVLSFFDSGRWAVEIFIILSGFVITQLLMTRGERYLPFLVRRIFRLFPAYLPMMALGGLSLYLAEDALSYMPWAGPDYQGGPVIRSWIAAQEQNFWPHLIAHSTLMHGVPPASVLPLGDSTFLPPAWSLTLEMQFYLVAPFIVAGLRKPRTGALIVALTFIALIAYEAGLFGERRFPSFLPAEGHHFLLGIATRLMWDRLTTFVRRPVACAIAFMAVAALVEPLRPTGVWLATICMIAGRASADAPVGYRLFDVATNSRVAQWAGSRSYSVYVTHLPIIYLCAWLIMRQHSFSAPAALLVVGAAAVVSTVLAAEALHRGIERPMMALGARLAARLSRPDANTVAAAAQ
jgi:peptidoglycan/LPS O-acetylase OafA/YrhL